MSKPPAMIEFRDAAGRSLRVEFIRRQDRYAHVISRLEGNIAFPIWESFEGTDADDWPPSPPLQQLSVETLSDGRRVALLVGMAGTSHWSLSVEAAPEGGAIIFDAACRVTQSPVALGSSYRRCSDEGSTAGPPLALWEGCNIPSDSGARSCDICLIGSVLSITPPALKTTLPGTARWKYRLTD